MYSVRVSRGTLGIARRIGANHDDVIMSIVVDARSAARSTPQLDAQFARRRRLSQRGCRHNWELIGLEGHRCAHSPPHPQIRTSLLQAPSMASTGRQLREELGAHFPENHADLRNFDSIAIDRTTPTQLRRHVSLAVENRGRRKKLGADSSRHGGRSDVMTITVDQNDASHIFASAGSGIYRSSDSGRPGRNSREFRRTHCEPCTFCSRSVRIPFTPPRRRVSGKPPMMAPLGAW